MAHINENRDALLGRIKRIAGQVGAVERALGGNANCTEVLHLVAAVRGAVNGLLDEIIVELKSGKLKNIAERSGRLQDGKHGLEELRREGYM